MTERAVPLIAITVGEPAGIGPEISLEAARVARSSTRVRPVLIGDGNMLAARARAAGIVIPLVAYRRDAMPPLNAVEVIDIPLATPVPAGSARRRPTVARCWR